MPERHHPMEGGESPVSVTGGRERIHSQLGYQLIHHIRRVTGSDVEGSRRTLSVTDRM